MTLGEEAVAELGPDAEQHLELVAVGRQPALADETHGLAYEPLVVRCDRRVGPAVEQGFEGPHEALPHPFVVAELDRLRLDVDPLAEPDAGTRERLRVGDGASERGLEHRADS